MSRASRHGTEFPITIRAAARLDIKRALYAQRVFRRVMRGTRSVRAEGRKVGRKAAGKGRRETRAMKDAMRDPLRVCVTVCGMISGAIRCIFIVTGYDCSSLLSVDVGPASRVIPFDTVCPSLAIRIIVRYRIEK